MSQPFIQPRGHPEDAAAAALICHQAMVPADGSQVHQQLIPKPVLLQSTKYKHLCRNASIHAQKLKVTCNFITKLKDFLFFFFLSFFSCWPSLDASRLVEQRLSLMNRRNSTAFTCCFMAAAGAAQLPSEPTCTRSLLPNLALIPHPRLRPACSPTCSPSLAFPSSLCGSLPWCSFYGQQPPAPHLIALRLRWGWGGVGVKAHEAPVQPDIRAICHAAAWWPWPFNLAGFSLWLSILRVEAARKQYVSFRLKSIAALLSRSKPTKSVCGASAASGTAFHPLGKKKNLPQKPSSSIQHHIIIRVSSIFQSVLPLLL